MQAYEGQFHLCVDGWTSPNVISFLGVVIQLVEPGQGLKSFILDFIKYVYLAILYCPAAMLRFLNVMKNRSVRVGPLETFFLRHFFWI